MEGDRAIATTASEEDHEVKEEGLEGGDGGEKEVFAGEISVGGDADETPREGACVLLLTSHEGGVRTAESHRDAEALRRADNDVRPQFTRRRDEHAREQVRGDDGDPACGVQRCDGGGGIHHRSRGARVRDQRAVDGGGVET